MRVLLPLDRLFLGFLANGKVYNAFGELVHVARARRCLAHAREYGASRQSCKGAQAMPPVKLSHYQRSAQLGCLPNMIQPPLLGVVNAASAVSARTLTCRA